MKNILLAIFLLSIPMESYAQQKNIRKFYRQYKKGKEVRNFIIPGFLIRLGTGFARDLVETDEQFEMLKLARSIRQARIMMSEDFNPVKKADFSDFVEGVRNTSYDDLISVRHEEANVQVMVREKGDKIKGLLILVSEEDTFLMLHLKTKLKYKDINRLIKLFREEIPIKQEEKKEEKIVVPVA